LICLTSTSGRIFSKSSFNKILGGEETYILCRTVIDQAMHGQFTWQFLALLAGMKIITTMLSFISGTPGGMFAPTLFIGAMLGAAVGGAEHVLLPSLHFSPGTYALVAMGVLFAGFLRAPMTSVFMVLEVSGNYSIILPVIVANTFAYVISRRLQPRAIFDVLTWQDGLDLPSMEEQREESVLRVEDAMEPPPSKTLATDDVVDRAWQIVDESPEQVCLVRLPPTGWGALGKDEIAKFVQDGKSGASIASVLTSGAIPYLHPDHPLDMALRYINR
jgi:CIC family chloride channel protein